MLQQTRVTAVIDYYRRFMADLPTLKDLAEASEDRLLALWSGLGYYSRARRLAQAAKIVVEKHGGELPQEYDTLLALPGFGPYTTAAVLSLSLNLNHAVLDGNVIRVYTRLFAIEEDVSQVTTLAMLQGIADDNLFRDRAAAWNEALMELGALVCTPRSPACDTCPLKATCQAFQQGSPQDLPFKRKAAVRPCYLQSSLLLLDQRGCLLMCRRPQKGLLAGLLALPELRGPQVVRRRLPKPEKLLVSQTDLFEFDDSGEELHAEHLVLRRSQGLPIEAVQTLPPFLHHYSHYSVEIHGLLCRLCGVAEPQGESFWLKPGEAIEGGISASDRRLIELLSLL